MSVLPARAAREVPAWMGKTASAASARPAPCPHSASPRAIPVPMSPAVTASAMMHLAGEGPSQPQTPPPLPGLPPWPDYLPLPGSAVCVSLAGVAPAAARAWLEMPVSLSPAGPAGRAAAMGWVSTAPAPLVSRVCTSPSLCSPTSTIGLISLLLSSLLPIYWLLFCFQSFPSRSLGGGYRSGDGLGEVGEMGSGNPSRLSLLPSLPPPTGRQCELLSPCTPNPCEHGGRCESAPGQLPVCSCPQGWQGMSPASLPSSSPSPLPLALSGLMLGIWRGTIPSSAFERGFLLGKTELDTDLLPVWVSPWKRKGYGARDAGIQDGVWGTASWRSRPHSRYLPPTETGRRPF